MNYPGLEYCNQFTRRADGGLNSLTTFSQNFASIEAEGYDLSVNYLFSIGANDFGVSLVGTRQEKLNRYVNPLDMSDVDVDLEEIRTPETTGNIELSWTRGDLSMSFQTTYQSRQAYREVEEALGTNGYQQLFGAGGGFFGSTLIHDINVSYQLEEGLAVFGGINNLTDEEPFATQTAWPVGPRGRTLFLGVNYTM